MHPAKEAKGEEMIVQLILGHYTSAFIITNLGDQDLYHYSFSAINADHLLGMKRRQPGDAFANGGLVSLIEDLFPQLVDANRGIWP
jgi:hypothetical protein